MIAIYRSHIRVDKMAQTTEAGQLGRLLRAD